MGARGGRWEKGREGVREGWRVFGHLGGEWRNDLLFGGKPLARLTENISSDIRLTSRAFLTHTVKWEWLNLLFFISLSNNYIKNCEKVPHKDKNRRENEWHKMKKFFFKRGRNYTPAGCVDTKDTHQVDQKKDLPSWLCQYCTSQLPRTKFKLNAHTLVSSCSKDIPGLETTMWPCEWWILIMSNNGTLITCCNYLFQSQSCVITCCHYLFQSQPCGMNQVWQPWPNG